MLRTDGGAEEGGTEKSWASDSAAPLLASLACARKRRRRRRSFSRRRASFARRRSVVVSLSLLQLELPVGARLKRSELLVVERPVDGGAVEEVEVRCEGVAEMRGAVLGAATSTNTGLWGRRFKLDPEVRGCS